MKCKNLFDYDMSKIDISVEKGLPELNVSEFFMDTIQGEGPTVGTPAAFLRLQGCTLSCKYCDTKYAWNPFRDQRYHVDIILVLMRDQGLVRKLSVGDKEFIKNNVNVATNNDYHLVITGGSPLLQQDALYVLIDKFWFSFGFIPIIEVENECIIKPTKAMDDFVSYWNNSPKLSTSGIPKKQRYFPEVLEFFKDSTAEVCYKFVITRGERDWKEIEKDFINPGFVLPEQIWLIPEGRTRDELRVNTEKTLKLCVKHSVHFSPRLQVDIWNGARGV